MSPKKYTWAKWGLDHACDGGINGVVDNLTESLRDAFAAWFAPLARAIGLPGLSVAPLSRGFEEHLDENREDIFGDAVGEFDHHLEEVYRSGAENEVGYLLESGEYVSGEEYSDKCASLESAEEEISDLEDRVSELEENDGFLAPCPRCPNGKLDGSTVDRTAFICDTCRTEFRLMEC